MPLDARHPATECIRSGRAQVLSRADLALNYPRYPRPDRLRCLVVLPLATATDRPAAWSLFFDQVASVDRGTRAMLDRAAHPLEQRRLHDTAVATRLACDPAHAAAV